jgi:putative DNA primase/helicase
MSAEIREEKTRRQRVLDDTWVEAEAETPPATVDPADDGEAEVRPPIPLRPATIAGDDDAALAQTIIDALETNGPLVFAEESFWQYDIHTGHWVQLHETDFGARILPLAGQELGKKRIRLTDRRLSSIRNIAKIHRRNEKFFDDAVPGIATTKRMIAVTDKGVERLPHSRKWKCRIHIPLEPQSGAPEKWLGFLNALFLRDHDVSQKIDTLQEFIGACLLGSVTKYQKSIVCVGDGGGGKSTLLAAVRALFPPDLVTSLDPHDMTGPRREYYLANLAGKRINISTEIPDRDMDEMSAIKRVITGDDVTARHPRGRPWVFKPIAGHIFACNTLPLAADTSDGFWRRMTCITFNRLFHLDTSRLSTDHIVAQLMTEKSAIIRWVIDGAARLERRGKYCDLPSSEHVLSEWRHDANPWLRFARDRLTPTDQPHQWDKCLDVFTAFRTWCAERNIRASSMTQFVAALRRHGIGTCEVPYRGAVFKAELARVAK